jgi:hypothetical protein
MPRASCTWLGADFSSAAGAPPARAFCVASSTAESTSVLFAMPGSSGRASPTRSVRDATTGFDDTADDGMSVRSGGQPEPSDHLVETSLVKKYAKNFSAAAFFAGSAWAVTAAEMPMADAAAPFGPAGIPAMP